MTQSFGSVAGLGRYARRKIGSLATEAVGHRAAHNYGLSRDAFRLVQRRWGDAGLFFMVAAIAAIGLPEDVRTGKEPMTITLALRDVMGEDEDITIDEAPPAARAFVRIVNCVACGDAVTGRDVWNSMPDPDKGQLAGAVTDMAVSALRHFREGGL